VVGAPSVSTVMLNEGLGDLAPDVLANSLTKGIVVVEDVGCEGAAITGAVALRTLEAVVGCTTLLHFHHNA
jgi:hypothetical protein